jgi:TRAP-type C4-dicarboxylate transport system permease small subunit
MYHYLDRCGQGLAFGAQAVGALTALVMVASLLLGVFYRYVLNSALVWSNEVAALAFTWTVFLFASALVRTGGHVRVTLLVDALPAWLGEVVERGILLLVFGFGLVMLWAGWNFAGFTFGQVSPAVRYPLWFRDSAVPVCGLLICLHTLILVLRPRPIHKAEHSHG